MTWIVVLSLAAPQSLWSQGNTWNRIRYCGGTVEGVVVNNPYDWNTTLTVRSDVIAVDFAHSVAVETLRIKPDQVTALSYGEEAHHRVADAVTLGVLFPPLALFGLLKSKAHFIGIEYRSATTTLGKYRTEIPKPGAILLEADKNSYRAILLVLKTVTGKPVQNAP